MVIAAFFADHTITFDRLQAQGHAEANYNGFRQHHMNPKSKVMWSGRDVIRAERTNHCPPTTLQTIYEFESSGEGRGKAKQTSPYSIFPETT